MTRWSSKPRTSPRRPTSAGRATPYTWTERYTRVDDETIDYRFTIDDPHTFQRPWTVVRPMNRITDRVSIFEYACHEGNYSMEGILAGARARGTGALTRGEEP